MRKLIVMAVLGYVWKKFVARKTASPTTVASQPETGR